MRLFKFLLCCCLWIFTPISKANDGQVKKCMEEALNQGGASNVYRITCLKKVLQVQERLLQATYMQRSSQLNANQRMLLKRSQLQWLAHRNARCAYEQSLRNTAPHPTVIELFCRIDLTEEQAKFID